MSTNKDDVMLIVPRQLRDRIKIAAIKGRKTMRQYLDTIVPQEKDL